MPQFQLPQIDLIQIAPNCSKFDCPDNALPLIRLPWIWLPRFHCPDSDCPNSSGPKMLQFQLPRFWLPWTQLPDSDFPELLWIWLTRITLIPIALVLIATNLITTGSPYRIALFHNSFSPSGEQAEQGILAYKSEQPTLGFITIFNKYCYIKHGGIITNLTQWNSWGYVTDMLKYHNAGVLNMD